VESGEPDLPFCIGWANHHWTKRWGAGPERMLVEQRYPGPHDHVRHFRSLERAFHDPRYIRVDGRPVVVIFDPAGLPSVEAFIGDWNTLAVKSGLRGIYFIGHLNVPGMSPDPVIRAGFDAALANISYVSHAMRNPLWVRACKRAGLQIPCVFSYERFVSDPIFTSRLPLNRHALVVPNWDDTPRRAAQGYVLHGSTPETFRRHLHAVLETASDQPRDRRLVFIRSWNEWAEGNYLEPDQQFGRGYLEALSQEVVETHAPSHVAEPLAVQRL
jgi:glycosyl transferase family WbsX